MISLIRFPSKTLGWYGGVDEKLWGWGVDTVERVERGH